MANKVFRFALGAAEALRSGVWRAWTHEDEIHLAVRSAQGEVALTIYPTGRWRITVGTAVSRWTRPREFRPGWTKGPDLVIPYSETPLRAEPEDPSRSEPISWLTPPGPGMEARFSLLIATPAAEASRWRPADAEGTEPVAALALRTAGMLHLSRRDEPMPADGGAGAGGSDPGPSEWRVVVSADATGCPSLHESHGP